MSLRSKWRVAVPSCAAIVAALALLGCGDASGVVSAQGGFESGLVRRTLEVTPRLELVGIEQRVGSVQVEELLINVDEVRLTPRDGSLEEVASEPLWVRYSRDTGPDVHGVEPLQVVAGEYGVSIALAPSSHARRTAGELNKASVVVRGVCLLFKAGSAEDPEWMPGFDPGDPRDPRDNPVPMPARPRTQPEGSELLRVPFSFSIESGLSLEIARTVSLVADGADLAVRLDVARWMEEAVPPIVATVVARPGRDQTAPVTLRFGEGNEDPNAEIFRQSIERSMAGSLTAELDTL